MKIKSTEYEVQAKRMTDHHIAASKAIIAAGKTPAVFDFDKVLEQTAPAKWLDENRVGLKGWTKTNTAILRKHVDLRIRLLKAGLV